MQPRHLYLAICCALLTNVLAASIRAEDDTLRCGSKLVSPGADMAYVLAQCGEPASKTRESTPQYARRPNGTTYVIGTVEADIWTYDRGSSRFPARLRFEAGKLVKLEFLRD